MVGLSRVLLAFLARQILTRACTGFGKGSQALWRWTLQIRTVSRNPDEEESIAEGAEKNPEFQTWTEIMPRDKADHVCQ